jgi:hypothetical protein
MFRSRQLSPKVPIDLQPVGLATAAAIKTAPAIASPTASIENGA